MRSPKGAQASSAESGGTNRLLLIVGLSNQSERRRRVGLSDPYDAEFHTEESGVLVSASIQPVDSRSMLGSNDAATQTIVVGSVLAA